MNILWIPNFCPFPADCGGKVVISHRMKYVAKRHNIFLITQFDGLEDDVHKELDALCQGYKLIRYENRSKFQFVKWALKGPINAGRYSNPEITKTIEMFLDKYNIDLINLDLPMAASALLPIWDKIEKIPVIINQHNIEFDNVYSKVKAKNVSFAMRVYAMIESKRLYSWERILYKKENIAAHIFLTEEDESLFNSSFNVSNEKLLVSQMGTDVAIEKCVDAPYIDGRTNIVFSAAYNYQPNVHGALWFVKNVFPIIREKCPDARLILVGRDPVKEIKELADNNIVVTGTVPTVKPYFSSADIFIIPIFFGGGVKTKLIEAGIYGKPVISTTSGARGTKYKDKEDILIADTPQDFAKACIDAIINSGDYNCMTQHMKEVTEKNYLWDAIGEKYVDYLENIKKFFV